MRIVHHRVSRVTGMETGETHCPTTVAPANGLVLPASLAEIFGVVVVQSDPTDANPVFGTAVFGTCA